MGEGVGVMMYGMVGEGVGVTMYGMVGGGMGWRGMWVGGWDGGGCGWEDGLEGDVGYGVRLRREKEGGQGKVEAERGRWTGEG